jgi:B12 binding domain/Radical SAM superfamily
MRRPVWLLSMDSEQFHAPPMTTGALAAHFQAYGRTAERTDVALVHFRDPTDVERWRVHAWEPAEGPRARAALADGLSPVIGLSCYTWNVAELLALARHVKAALPGVLVVAGGPHVQRAEDFLFDEAVDLVVLGEGEATFTELLDCPGRDAWAAVAGCAYVRNGCLVRTPPRARCRDLDRLPSALDVIRLHDAAGAPLYRQIAYETSRGCPFRCAFCEWGTGAIGTKMHQLSLARVQRDLDKIAAAGIRDLWLCDSNFGALREDEAKAEMVVALHRRVGLPRSFATSWSKNHNGRVQRIVRMLHRSGLLSHYHLALQTLTPAALALSHRTNMRANDYEPIVKSLAEAGIPVAAELIWGLPGDTLAAFEASLDHLLTVFPSINIFGYTLLPGTEFFDRRAELRLETVPVAGYGKAKGEYVVGCGTFTREEGEEGYFLLAAYVVLTRGQLMALTVRHLALARRVPVAPLLRAVLRALLVAYGEDLTRLEAYEDRSRLYVRFVRDLPRTYDVIRRTVQAWLARPQTPALVEDVMRLLALDEALCPRAGVAHTLTRAFDFGADDVAEALGRMDRPSAVMLAGAGTGIELRIEHPGGVGEVVLDPDGGAWARGRIAGAAPLGTRGEGRRRGAAEPAGRGDDPHGDRARAGAAAAQRREVGVHLDRSGGTAPPRR